MTRKKDHKFIGSKKCQEKDCKKEAYAIAKAKFLCKKHYREIVPKKEHHFRHSITRGLIGIKFKETLIVE